MITVDITKKIINTILGKAGTADKIAAATGVSSRSVYAWHAGKRRISLQNAILLCDTYGMKLSDYCKDFSYDAYLVCKAIKFCGDQYSLAKAMGYRQQTISKYLHQYIVISPYVAYKIEKATKGHIEALEFSSLHS